MAARLTPLRPPSWEPPALLREADAMCRKARAALRAGQLQNAAEDAYGCVIRSVQSVAVSLAGEQPVTHGQIASVLDRLWPKYPRVPQLRMLDQRFEKASSKLHGTCFYERICEPVSIRAVLDAPRLARLILQNAVDFSSPPMPCQRWTSQNDYKNGVAFSANRPPGASRSPRGSNCRKRASSWLWRTATDLLWSDARPSQG